MSEAALNRSDTSRANIANANKKRGKAVQVIDLISGPVGTFAKTFCGGDVHIFPTRGSAAK